MSNGQVIRVEKNGDFTVMNNAHLKDTKLSWRAKGLLSFMLSLPPNWDFSVAGLVSCGPSGRVEINSILTELEEHGYLHRQQERVAGKFGASTFVIYEGGLVQGSSYLPQAGSPLTVSPLTVSPFAVNQQQLNTNINKVLKETNTDKAIDPQAEAFEKFWNLYPRKSSKPMTWRAWKNINPTGKLIEQIMQSVQHHRLHDEQWRKDNGKYIPMPSTFLNQRRWEDSIDISEPVLQPNPNPHKPRMSQDEMIEYMAAESARYDAELEQRKAKSQERVAKLKEQWKNGTV